jgi:leader peptidase (prepilin peptidase) / N-methyltransferase
MLPAPSDPIVLVPIAAFGLIFGSFVTALSYRLPRGESIAHGRSRCPVCGHTLTAPDLVPVLSWAVRRGACRYCGAKISARYPAIELLTAILFTAAGTLAADFTHLILLVAMTPVMVGLAVIDLEHRRLPNVLVLLLAALALVWRGSGDQAMLTGLVIAPLAWFICVLLDLGCKAFGKTGLALGDMKLIALAGLALPVVPFLLFLTGGWLLGLIWAGLWRAARPRQGTFPFAPAILTAYWLSLAVGQAILQRLVGFLSG